MNTQEATLSLESTEQGVRLVWAPAAENKRAVVLLCPKEN